MKKTDFLPLVILLGALCLITIGIITNFTSANDTSETTELVTQSDDTDTWDETEVEDEDETENESDYEEPTAKPSSSSEVSTSAASALTSSAESFETSSQPSSTYTSSSEPQTSSYSEHSYEYQPPHTVNNSQTVYVNAAIPGRYHLDPNCRGLTRYGGGTALSLADAQAQGYVVECAYERYE